MGASLSEVAFPDNEAQNACTGRRSSEGVIFLSSVMKET